MTTEIEQTAPRNTTLAAGFKDPVHEAQACFRAVMNAMARPGLSQTVPATDLLPPKPLTPAAAAIALTLLDYDTPVWLDKPLAASADVKTFLRFHTGAPIVSEPVEAAFAFVSDPASMIPLANFNQGSPEYPDRSTTLILMGQYLRKSAHVTLHGPGIQAERGFSAKPVPTVFWDQVITNNAQFPRGVDLIFAGDEKIAALPRSTRITLKES